MKSKFYIQPWLLILIVGVALFLLTQQATIITANTNYLPTLLLLGSFVVPVSFVAYFYEYVKHREISVSLLTTCLLAGGVLGSIFAGVVESGTLTNFNVAGLFAVGLIEEAAKLIFPLVMYFGRWYRHEADGLLFGVAAGMGFAALETMGYGLTTLIDSNGDINSLTQVLLARGLVSPAGHAAWTGFVCAILWRERERKPRGMLNLAAMAAFVVAVALHSVWNIVNGVGGSAVVRIVVTVAGSLAIAVTSLILLFRRVRESRRPARLEPANVDDLSSL